MSEAEIKKRYEYKRNRQKWMLIQAAAIALTVIIAIGSFLIYNNLNQTYYIEYTEDGSVDYKVQYRENDFFTEEWIGSGQSYVTSLADNISADFSYKMYMDTANVGFDYTYGIVAKLIIADKTTGDFIYAPEDVLAATETKSISGSDSISVRKSVLIDFDKYETEARDFIRAYGLKNVNAYLLVTMDVSVLSASSEFESNNSNAHAVSLNIPLCQENFSITTGASTPAGESKVLACKSSMNQNVFLTLAIVACVLAVLMSGALTVFVFVTRNEDVNYTIKVQKILRAYRSFIQQMDGDFDSTGYQIVPIKSFVEMLGIRDTIQSPVLMSENKDKTMSQFLIPTNTKILYVFEIKVDNYDEIYNKVGDDDGEKTEGVDATKPPVSEKAEPAPESKAEPAVEKKREPVPEQKEQVEEPQTEEPTAEEPKVEEAVTAPASEPEAEDDDDGDVIEVFDENNNKLSIQCRRSCLANIIQSENEGAKKYYSEIKNYILSFKGVKARMSWKYESFNKGRSQLFKLKIRGKTICLYCALDPKEFEQTKYFHEATDAKTFEKVPMLVRIRSDRGLKRAMKLVSILMEREAIAANEKYEATDFVSAHPYERTQALIDKGLVKILAPEGYVVVDPHHVVHATALKEEPKVEEPKVEEPVAVAEPAPEADGDDDGDVIEVFDENNNKLSIQCRRSCLANIIQSENEGAKKYYSEIKNYILSFKGVKARMSWKYESFNKGRSQLFKLKIRGKTICLYCALDPKEFEQTKYFHEATDAKTFEKVPMLVRIRSDRGLKRAMKLVSILMEREAIAANEKYEATDFVSAHPYERTQALIDKGLVKILAPEGYVVVDPHHVVHATPLKEEPKVEELEMIVMTPPETEDDDIIEVFDENNNKLSIQCRRSCLANIIQSENEGAKKYYSEIKNYILSFKGVKARMSWKYESFNKGRCQLFKLKIRGKTICLYCALDPKEFEQTKYFHEATDAKTFEKVPMLVRIRSDRGLKRAMKLVALAMERNGVEANPKFRPVDYVTELPNESTKALIDKNLIKIN